MEETIKGWSMQNNVKFTISQCQSLDTYLCDWVVFLLSSSCEDFLVFPLSPSPFLVLLTTIKCQHYQQQLPIDAEPGDCVINCMQDFTCNSSLRRIRLLNIMIRTFDKVLVSTMMNIFYRILMFWYFLLDAVVTGNGVSCAFVFGLNLGLITSTLLFNELSYR